MDVVSIADKAIVRKAARSVVGIVSRVPDGKEIMQCSGIIVDWNETSKLATIVTCSAAVCYDGALVHPKPNLRILLPNNTNVEGQLLFFNARYNIALLEAMVDSPLEPANFGSCPNFGQKVFALARDHKASLFARHGSILFQEPPSFFVDKYWLSLSSEVALCGTGGPAIDEHGNVVGMTFGRLPYPDILSISILQTCIDMWRRHRYTLRDLVFSRVMSLFHTMDVAISFYICLRRTFSVLAGVFLKALILAGLLIWSLRYMTLSDVSLDVLPLL
ncbi:uncharacterized protein LOC107304245 [Oryza brachyantha]|uniref:uncharacterized protein LOC107304245 n=1 Tax=Oryza brachyantha TaxID=4533 RepID=UPI0007763CBF|nr:uncharacterized protein LOC107304245 [Oryza brachyantha]